MNFMRHNNTHISFKQEQCFNIVCRNAGSPQKTVGLIGTLVKYSSRAKIQNITPTNKTAAADMLKRW